MSIDSQAPLGGPPIGVIGVGYVGLVTAVCFADLGYHVICRDIDADRIEALRAGRVPIFEPDVEPVLERNRDRLQFTLDLDPSCGPAGSCSCAWTRPRCIPVTPTCRACTP